MHACCAFDSNPLKAAHGNRALSQGSFAFIMAIGSVRASRKLHHNLLRGLLRLPMSFFDSQPTGRLMNRFTKDTQAVDLTLFQVRSGCCYQHCPWQCLLSCLHAVATLLHCASACLKHISTMLDRMAVRNASSQQASCNQACLCLQP